MGGLVGDAVTGEAGGDETERGAEGELPEQPGRKALRDHGGDSVGVGAGEFAQGGEVVVQRGGGDRRRRRRRMRRRRLRGGRVATSGSGAR